MKIICIGRNYADHARELKNEVPAEPVIFLKPDTAQILSGHPFFIPEFSHDVHYECEVVVKINRLGKNIDEKFAHRYYEDIALGIDFTARDVQQEMKSKGLPWEKAKAFDGSAMVGNFVSVSFLKDRDNIEFSLLKNGEEVQHGFTRDMLFPIDRIIAYVSRFFTLKIGDLIFTGTPAGVGPVNNGDELEGVLEGESNFKLRIK